MTDTGKLRLKLEQTIEAADVEIRAEPGKLTIEGDAAAVLEIASQLFTTAWSLAWAAGMAEVQAIAQRARDASGGMPELGQPVQAGQKRQHDA